MRGIDQSGRARGPLAQTGNHHKEQGGDYNLDECPKCGRVFLSVPRTEVCDCCQELPRKLDDIGTRSEFKKSDVRAAMINRRQQREWLCRGASAHAKSVGNKMRALHRQTSGARARRSLGGDGALRSVATLSQTNGVGMRSALAAYNEKTATMLTAQTSTPG